MTDRTRLRPIRTYGVTVYGYDGAAPALYSARSPAKARWRAYCDFRSCFPSTSFHEFLTRSTIRVVPDPPGVGARILVSGKPATRCYGYHGGGCIPFMRDDDDVVLWSHPLDVSPLEADAT